MLAPSGELLRAGLALKLNHLKRATQAYLRDRTSQAAGQATSYAVAGGLFAAAGVFVLAACFVAIMALFRWVELKYGQFWAFGTVGALLIVLAAVCAGIAMAGLKRRPRPVVPLASRLRVAIATPRIPRGTIKEAVKEVATTLPLASRPSRDGSRADAISALRINRSVQLGLIIAAAGLVGLTAAKRRPRSRRRSDS